MGEVRSRLDKGRAISDHSSFTVLLLPLIFPTVAMDWKLAVIGLVVAAALLSLFGLWRALSCEAGWRAWICYRIAMVHRFVFSRCTQENACTIPEDGPAIIVANHTSPLDPVVLWTKHFASFRRPHLRVIGYMMAKEYYIRSSLIGWVCRAMESIPVERSGRDMVPIREALRRLGDGKLLGLFPEGRINLKSPDEQLLPGGTGIAWLALKSGAPVIPVFIRNSPRSPSMVRAFIVRTRTSLCYGPPIDLSRWKDAKGTHDELAEVTDYIMSHIANLGGLRITPVHNSRSGGAATRAKS